MLNLRVRSGYSFRAAFGHLDEVMECLPGDVAALTDRASTFGHIRWNELCKKNGKRPIFGVELCVAAEWQKKKTTTFNATFLPYHEVTDAYRIFETATQQFKYEPRLSYANVSEVLVGGRVGIIVEESFDPTRLGPDANLFVAVHPGSAAYRIRSLVGAGYAVIAVGDNYFPRFDDRGAYEVLCGRGSSSHTYPQFIIDEAQWRLKWGREPWADEAIANTYALADRCRAELKKAKLFVPQHDMSLREMCFAGAIGKNVDLWNDPIYSERLDRELSVIEAKNFADYFYIIADLMNYAKANMFCGPARGSSCGSLVCYLLDITTVDPIKFDLIFERFIDLNRSDLPDIDIDLADTKRELVFKYLVGKYGLDHVAQLGTTMFFKTASTVNEVCGALGISKYSIQKFVDGLEDRDEGHPRVNDCIEDAFQSPAGKAVLEKHPEFAIATRIEGHPRHYSRHAAGVIITADPILSHVAIDARVNATQCEKRDAEKMDLLKIDCLGLTQLGVFDHALQLIGKPREWLMNFPIDDPGALSVFNSGHLTGVFQFNGPALREMTKQVNVATFEDLVSLTSLARPGPMQSGGAAQWIKVKNGVTTERYAHESLRPILGNTYGCVVFQEQVMRICREIGGMEWTDVSALRKAMGKTMGVEYFNKWKDKFIPGAIAVGFTPDDADNFWLGLCENGSYLFNRSHAVAYSFISYWCAVLKHYHPLEFAAATLTVEKDKQMIIALLKDLEREGMGYTALDVELSDVCWTVADDKLIGPLTGIKGIGAAKAEEIIERRRLGVAQTKMAAKLLANAKTDYDSLYPIHNAFAPIFQNPSAHNIKSAITEIETLGENDDKELVVIAEVLKLNDRDKNDSYNLEKRGGKEMKGQTKYLSMNVADDSGSIYINVSTRDYLELAPGILERGLKRRPVYLFKGRIGKGYRMIHLERYKFLGFLDAGTQELGPEIEAALADGKAICETEKAV